MSRKERNDLVVNNTQQKYAKSLARVSSNFTKVTAIAAIGASHLQGGWITSLWGLCLATELPHKIDTSV